MSKKIIGTIWRKMPRLFRAKIIRWTQAKFTASVAAVVFNEKGKILLLDHVLRPSSGWGIPGGFINHFEQPEEALRRELREETGLELENVRLFRARVLKSHIEFIFTAETKGKAEVKSREILRAEWFYLDTMPEDLPLAQKSTVKEVLNFLENKNNTFFEKPP